MLLLLIPLFTVSISLQAKTMGFDDLKYLLQKNNLDVKGAEFNLEAAQIKSGALERSFMPRLNLYLGRERFTTGPYNNLTQSYGSAGVSFNLFNGGKDLLRADQVDLQIDLAKADKEIVQMDRLTKLRSLYWQAISQNEIHLVFQDALSLNEQNLLAAKKRINAGLATPTDKLDFEQFKLDLLQLSERSRVFSENMKEQIKSALQLPTDVNLTDESVPHIHHDELYERHFNVEDHREIKSLNAQKDFTNKQQSIQKRWWAPEVDAYGAYSHFTQKDRDYSDANERDDKTVGVVLKMDIYDGGESFNESKAQALRAQGLEYNRLQKLKDLSATYTNAKRSLHVAHELVHFAEDNVLKAENYLKRTLEEYSRGVKNSPDVLQASSRYLDSKVKFVELRRDYQLARVEFLNALGE